jgi:hypothetical protein
VKALSNVLICGFIVLLPALVHGDNFTFDLSSPDKTIASFLDAVRSNDVESVTRMLSPRIKKMIRDGNMTSEGYVKAWSQYPVVRIGKAEVSQFSTDTRVLAGADVVFLVNGKEYSSRVGVIKAGNIWLWNEK